MRLLIVLLAASLGACADDVIQSAASASDTGADDDAGGQRDGDLPDAAGDDVLEDTPVEDTPVEDTALDAPGEDTLADAVTDDVTDDVEPDVDPGPQPVDPPGPPANDTPVHIVSVTVRTGTAATAGTDDGVELCLGPAACYRLDTPDVNDREPGNTEVHHLRGLNLSPSDLTQLRIATTSTAANNDRWSPACIDVRLDGVPTYCNTIPVHIGTGGSSNEVPSWTDPDGLHNACTTCERGTLTHGPMLGPPATDSARVWVRTDATRLTGLRLGLTRDLRDAPIVAWAWPRPEDDFTATLVADGLSADTEYFYRVEVDGDTAEPVRGLHTAPTAAQALPTRITIGSCTRRDDQPIFTPILAGQPDLFVFLGDNNYANTHFRDALRWNYRRFRNVRERAALVATTPTLAIWDDHDFLANNSNGTCVDRDEALAAFKEFWANPSYGTAEAPGVYFRQRWGAVDLFMLDCRMYRPDVGDLLRRCDLDPNPPTLPVSGGPLGPVQERWLLDGLASSDATFKLVACGSRFSPDGSVDSWASFPQAFNRLVASIDSNAVGGVVFLSGDIHRSMFKRVPAPGYPIPELTSSPLAYIEPGSCGSEPNTVTCFDGTDSYVDLDVDPTLDDPTLTARLRDEHGNEVYQWVIRRSELE